MIFHGEYLPSKLTYLVGDCIIHEFPTKSIGFLSNFSYLSGRKTGNMTKAEKSPSCQVFFFDKFRLHGRM